MRRKIKNSIILIFCIKLGSTMKVLALLIMITTRNRFCWFWVLLNNLGWNILWKTIRITSRKQWYWWKNIDIEETIWKLHLKLKWFILVFKSEISTKPINSLMPYWIWLRNKMLLNLEYRLMFYWQRQWLIRPAKNGNQLRIPWKKLLPLSKKVEILLLKMRPKEFKEISIWLKGTTIWDTWNKEGMRSRNLNIWVLRNQVLKVLYKHFQIFLKHPPIPSE